MRAPAGRPHLPALLSATALALLARLAVADVPAEAKQAIQAGLPRYDPAAYEKAQADKAARAAPKNAPAALSEPTPATPTPTTSAAASEHTLALPTVTVHPNTDFPKPLPRITEHQPLHDTPTELFESPAGRDARLVRNHLSKFDQIVGRLFGFNPVVRAKEREAEKEKARQMNEFAAALEMQAALGRDPEEIKKLRAEYTKLYYSGPK